MQLCTVMSAYVQQMLFLNVGEKNKCIKEYLTEYVVFSCDRLVLCLYIWIQRETFSQKVYFQSPFFSLYFLNVTSVDFIKLTVSKYKKQGSSFSHKLKWLNITNRTAIIKKNNHFSCFLSSKNAKKNFTKSIM